MTRLTTFCVAFLSNRRNARRVLMFALAVIAAGCSKQHDGVLDLTTKGGSTIRNLVGDEPTVVLVYAASTCFSCSTSLHNWEMLARAKRLKVLVALAGTVTEADLRNLRIQRVRAVELAGNPAEESVFIPSEHILLGGRVIQRASGEAEIRERRLWRVVDADTARFPGTMISATMTTGAH